MDNDRLQDWTVHVSQGSSGNTCSLGEGEYSHVIRSWKAADSSVQEQLRGDNHFRIGAATSPKDERVDLDCPPGLDPDDVEEALKLTVEAYHANPGRRSGPPEEPSGRFLRRYRPASRGLLILYPIDATKAHNLDARPAKGDYRSKPFIGFAISLPYSGRGTQVEYVVNNVYQQGELEFEQEESEAHHG